MAWFNYNGSGSPVAPASYTLAGSTPSCTDGFDLCAIQATNDGTNHPEFTESLKNDMITALVAHQGNGNVKLKD